MSGYRLGSRNIPYVHGADLTIFTDHAALRSILSTKTPKGRIAHWIMLVQAYEFKVIHRKGSANLDADALSTRQNNQEHTRSQGLTMEAAKMAQMEDPFIQETKNEYIKSPFSVQGDLLFHGQPPVVARSNTASVTRPSNCRTFWPRQDHRESKTSLLVAKHEPRYCHVVVVESEYVGSIGYK